jgi:hypothetical protein
MAHLPQFERRPSASYYIGEALGRGCLTSSILLNILRLLGVTIALPHLFILIVDGAGMVQTAIGIGLIMLSFVLPGTRQARQQSGETWNSREVRLRKVVEDAISAGLPIQAAISAAGLEDELAIDYGVTADERRPILVAKQQRRAHQLTTGGAGTGKSKFIAMQAAQGAVCGASLVVIDPHEELAQDILCAAAPILAERGCIIIWPEGPTRRIYPWNPLWTGPGREPWQAADLVVAAVKRVWQLTDANTFIIDVLRHTAWALAGAGWTLLEGARFLTEERFRDYVAQRAGIPEVASWVARYNAMNARDRQGLIQTTLVRLNRLSANPHIRRIVGCGVTDPAYGAMLRREGMVPIAGADLVGDINRGIHLFAALPARALGEDQYVIAGLVQSALLTAALNRKPNDPAMHEVEAYLDEAAAYANAEGLGKILAQARKYKLSAMVAMQGLHQAEAALAAELETNTAIKTVFATDRPDEAERAAAMLFRYDPTQIKIDARQRTKTAEGERREHGLFQTYGPLEQRTYYTGQILSLPPRHYVLKVRGEDQTPLLAYTPNYTARYTLEEAMRLVRTRRVAAYTSMEQIDRELLVRHRWLESALYQARPGTTAPETSTYGSAERVAPEPTPLHPEGARLDLVEQADTEPHPETAIPASFESADGSTGELACGEPILEGDADEEQRIEIEQEDGEHRFAEAEERITSFGDDG